MLERAVVLAGALIVGLILFLPSHNEGLRSQVEPMLREAPHDAIGAATSAQQDAQSSWYGGAHSLRRESDGHFYANGYVQGNPVRFLVDTGASVVALTADDAYAAGIDWDDDKVRVIGSGASGPVYGIARRISELEIGGITRRDIDAVIIPRGLDISLLGQSFLSKVESVEIAGDEMLLKDG